MHHALRLSTLAAAFALTTVSPNASAQAAVTFRATCQDVGMSGRDVLTDREGHFVTVGQYSCRDEGGVADGTLMSGMVIWEWDKGSAGMLAGNGTLRKPGAVAVYENSGGRVTLTIVDGKVTGLDGTSKGVYKVATGAMAGLAGKSFTTTFHAIAGGQFILEETIE